MPSCASCRSTAELLREELAAPKLLKEELVVRHGEDSSKVSTYLLSLPMLMEEALQLCAFLSPEDLAQLMNVTSWAASSEDREALWRSYYVLRWGAAHGVNRSTIVRVMRSWFEDPWPAPWYLCFGFCGAQSSLDHLFWFLPLWRGLLRYQRQPYGPLPAQPAPMCWQAVCRLRARPDGAARVARCCVCNVLEVAPPGPAPQHWRRRWVRPCKCSLMAAHRTCLERQLLKDPVAAKKAQERLNPPFRLFQRDQWSDSPLSSQSGDFRSSLRCQLCGKEFHTSGRFPETLGELFVATYQGWRWAIRRALVMMVFYMWMYSLASHYCGYTMSFELAFILLLTAAMMSITLSQRFHHGVQKIWNTPHRWQYFKLFFAIAVQNYLVSIRVVEPSVWLPQDAPDWRVWLHAVHVAIRSSIIGDAILFCVSWLHMLSGSGLIFLFWKTSLRLPTIADLDDGQSRAGDDGSSRASSPEGTPVSRFFEHSCGLCQLGLCLDNACM
eukprot:TRINITY_DN65348_c0_g1_i1.p1 TRINITY_DN65348_c0_g1~~TRINITY_DN65348_c0_g1_i1.p1  ORF type:complete len:497 (+),score=48.18 TRINITY_DN65348_c0_g1_i1:96-1586(+)